jgi:hypothetical protein
LISPSVDNHVIQRTRDDIQNYTLHVLISNLTNNFILIKGVKNSFAAITVKTYEIKALDGKLAEIRKFDDNSILSYIFKIPPYKNIAINFEFVNQMPENYIIYCATRYFLSFFSAPTHTLIIKKETKYDRWKQKILQKLPIF